MTAGPKLKAQNHSDSYVNCHICETRHNVDLQVYKINTDNNHGKDIAGTKCTNCGTLMSVVITIYGVRTVENLLKERINEKEM